ncbi:hypothetical protein [Corynebacterium hindlerae]|uniref:hypothetical protein n=1 Tax=Corynebacterium hindlerae TaxID=699041 RepID=UPI003AAF6258
MNEVTIRATFPDIAVRIIFTLMMLTGVVVATWLLRSPIAVGLALVLVDALIILLIWASGFSGTESTPYSDD